jgi:hypothetical protein
LIIKDALQIVTTIGSLFSPLLAFVLGYYFNHSQMARDASNKSQGREEAIAEKGNG